MYEYDTSCEKARDGGIAAQSDAYQGWDASVARSPFFSSLYVGGGAVSTEVEIFGKSHDES